MFELIAEVSFQRLHLLLLSNQKKSWHKKIRLLHLLSLGDVQYSPSHHRLIGNDLYKTRLDRLTYSVQKFVKAKKKIESKRNKRTI